MGSDARDYDNDGRIDIFSNNLMGQVWQLYRNRGAYFRYVPELVHIQQLSEQLSPAGAMASSTTTTTAGSTSTPPTATWTT